MNRLTRWVKSLHIELSWVGAFGVTLILLALLLIPNWQNNIITESRERSINIGKFIDDCNELEVVLQDMRLAVRGYIISQNVFFSQQYIDASARQANSIERLMQDASLVEDVVNPGELNELNRQINEWRVKRLDHQVALVNAGNIVAATQDFELSTSQQYFDNIRNTLIPMRVNAKNKYIVIQNQTTKLYATNLLVNSVLTCVALGALVIVLLGVIRQKRLLVALQLAKSESNELTNVLSTRLKELHYQNERLATAQLIMTRAMQIGHNTYHMQRIVQTVQQTLQVPLVALWRDADVQTHPIVTCCATDAHDDLAGFPATIAQSLLTELFTLDAITAPVRVAYDNIHEFVLFPLVVRGHRVGVLGLLLSQTTTIDNLILQQITIVIDNFQLFQQLQLEQQRLRVLFDVVPLGFVLVDAQGIVLVKNQQAQQFIPQLTNTSDCRHALATSMFYGMGGYVLQTEDLPLIVALTQSTVGTHDVMHELAGARVPIRHQVVAIYDGDIVNGYVLILDDLRQVYELERLKADFVSMVSHELRTPLAAIVGATTMLTSANNTSPRDVQQEMLLLIQLQGQRLQTLIEDILNLARIDREGVRLRREVIDPLTLIRRVVGNNLKIKRRVRITTKGTIPNVWIDNTRIEQVISNILDNTEKYAPYGEVDISLVMRTSMPPMVTCVVRDYGTALSEIECQRVFDRFYQGQRQSSHGGVGLGLAICKYFVEAHGGVISMQPSLDNNGTVVEFTMPLAEITQHALLNDKNSEYRVLLIEDDSAMQRIMQQMLHMHHFEVVTVGTVFQAHEKITRNQFDLLIVDVMLPDGSGLDFVREVRVWLDTPIMVVTARGNEQDVLTGLRAGVDDYMVKPFNYEEFVLRIQALCRRSGGFDAKSATLAIGNLQISFADKQLMVNDQKIEVTPIEYQMMRYLMRHVGQILTHEQILQGVWGERYDQENQYLWVHISHIRRKLQIANVSQLRIENIRGVGYRLEYIV